MHDKPAVSRQYPAHKVPLNEIEQFVARIRKSHSTFDEREIQSAYRKCGYEPISNPYDSRIAEDIVHALKAKSPYSAIRIGDGEARVRTH